MRLALPGYRLVVYNPGGPVFTSLSGQVGGCNGYPSFTERRRLDENWRSLRQGMGTTLVWGEVADEDPPASLPDVTCRLFSGCDYFVVVGARVDSNDPLRFPDNTGLASKREPFTVRVKGASGPIEGAYLYDLERATITRFKVQNDGEAWTLPIDDTNWFMVVLRRPQGPAIGSFNAVRTLHAGESAELRLELLSGQKSKETAPAQLSSRGLAFAPANSPSISVSLPGKATLVVPAGTPPGRYEVELRGEKLLGIKRFIVVE